MTAQMPRTAGVTPEQCLIELGLELPPRPQTPIGNFQNIVRLDNLLFVSGQGPVTSQGRLMTGKVGQTITTEQACVHARFVGLNILAAIKEEVGELAKIRRIVKLLGLVNAVPDFKEHPDVIDGCSDLFCRVLGPAGIHARSSIGVSSLPNNISVEIEAIIAL